MSFRIYPEGSEGRSLEDADKTTAQDFVAERRTRTQEILARLKRNSPLAYGYAMAIDALINDATHK